MKKCTIIANWKMYMTAAQSAAWCTTNYQALKKLAQSPSCNLVIAPSFTALQTMQSALLTSNIKLCAQDCSPYQPGAYTGQISAQDLTQIGCSYSLIGHSELRINAHQSNDIIALKYALLHNVNVTPVVCVGESEDEYINDLTYSRLEAQLRPIIDAHTLLQTKQPLVIAYEPVWAIGTGKTPYPETVTNICSWIEDFVKIYLPDVELLILYGGSVSDTTVHQYKAIDKLSGFLIGKASTDFQTLQKIVHSLQDL